MRQRSYPDVKGPDVKGPDVKGTDVKGTAVRHPSVQPADSATTSASALRAVQVALDRRDNGGNTRTGDDEQGR